MHYRNRLVSFCIFIVISHVCAEEHAASVAIIDQDYSGKQSLEWEKIQAKLGSIKGKLDAQVTVIKSLIADKARLTGNDQAMKMEELKKEHIKLEKMTEEYNQLNLEYMTKFPERGIKENRLYKRIKSKSLQAYEEDFTIQGRVNRLHGKILNQYSKAGSELKKKKGGPRGLQQNKTEDTPAKKDEKEVTGQIILKK